jgi:uncharacterized membrane protein
MSHREFILKMCKIFLIAGVALLFFGLATFAHDAVNQADYNTTVGDLFDTIGISYYYKERILDVSEIFRTLMVLPFAYAAVLIGVFASIGGAVCTKAGRRPES